MRITLLAVFRSRPGLAAALALSPTTRAPLRRGPTDPGRSNRPPRRGPLGPSAGFDQPNGTTAAGSAASTLCKSLAHRMGRPWVAAVLGLHLHAVCSAHQRMRAEHVIHRDDL